MSSGPLPARVDAFRPFVRQSDMTGSIALERMPRLVEYLLDVEQAPPVEAELHFSRTEQRQRLLSGHLKGSFSMRCQRCLGPVAVAVFTELNLAVAGSESELAAMAAEQDAVLCEGEDFQLLAALEDELILGLPLVPRHDDQHCHPSLNRLQEQARDDAADSRTADPESGPFAELAKLKGRLDKGDSDSEKGGSGSEQEDQ